MKKTDTHFKQQLARRMAPLRERWEELEQREQNLLLLAGTVLLLAFLWWVTLAPALNTLRTAPTRMAAADSQLQQMRQMQAQADMLRQLPQGNASEARKLLEQSAKIELAASAQLQWLGNRVQVTLNNTPAPALTRWLMQIRDNSRASVVEMKLNRQNSDSASPAKDTLTTTLWSGSLLLELPGDMADPH